MLCLKSQLTEIDEQLVLLARGSVAPQFPVSKQRLLQSGKSVFEVTAQCLLVFLLCTNWGRR